MSKPTVAILADFPVFEVDPMQPRPRGHYAIWLSALFDSLKTQDEYNIHWVTLCKHLPDARHIIAGGQHFHLLPRARKKLGLYSLYVYDRFHVAQALKQIHPDLVHAWGTEDCYALCGKDFAGRKLLSIQGLLRTYMQRARMSTFERHHSLYEIPAIKAYRHITTESPWAAEQALALAPGRVVHHLEYAVEERFFDMQRHPSETPTVLFGGTNTPVKNIPTLVRAFSDPRLAHVTLRLAGPEPNDFPQGLPNNITALGRISRDDMVREMASVWCLVHPSLADTGPTVAKEARVIGLPVILSTACGSKQHIVEGKSGYIIDPLDTEQLIRAVLSVTASRETSIGMGRFGQEQCRRALCSETMRERLLEIYRERLAEQ